MSVRLVKTRLSVRDAQAAYVSGPQMARGGIIAAIVIFNHLFRGVEIRYIHYTTNGRKKRD